MIVALIAGGAGTRLWPLSTPDYPKHLLTVTGDQTLIQAAYERAKHITDTVYVVTEASHDHHVRKQLPDVTEERLIIEPARRNTSGCFLAVLCKIKRSHPADEPIAFTWSDHYIRDIAGFAESFKIAGEATIKYKVPVLVGIEPTYPATGFGYIHKAELLPGEQLVHKSSGFKEKPDLETAQSFFKSGEYLWNGGYLVGTLEAYENAMQRYCPKLWQDYQSLLNAQDEAAYKEAYLALESVALDYTFNELVGDMLVVPGTFDWTLGHSKIYIRQLMPMRMATASLGTAKLLECLRQRIRMFVTTATSQ